MVAPGEINAIRAGGQHELEQKSDRYHKRSLSGEMLLYDCSTRIDPPCDCKPWLWILKALEDDYRGSCGVETVLLRRSLTVKRRRFAAPSTIELRKNAATPIELWMLAYFKSDDSR